jgi:hypothetical protein
MQSFFENFWEILSWGFGFSPRGASFNHHIGQGRRGVGSYGAQRAFVFPLLIPLILGVSME